MTTFLRLVYDAAKDEQSSSDISIDSFQQTFLEPNSRSIVASTTDHLAGDSFIELISRLAPGLVLDTRVTPTFDFGTLNRKKAFALFEAFGSQYIDFGGQVLDSEHIAPIVSSSSTIRHALDSTRCALVLLDSRARYAEQALLWARAFRNASQKDWDVVIHGAPEVSPQQRRTLFVSHAYPEDNAFALWLEAQLVRNGYEVWTDITSLGGGEYFWDTIEEVIRKDAARVLAVVSRSSISKPGVQDELSLAISVERSQSLANFVIPLRVDDLPYSEFRANIARRNAIDFGSGWAVGLQKLLSTLAKEAVPRRSASASDLRSWWESRSSPPIAVVREPETLVSNEIPLVGLPPQFVEFEALAGDFSDRNCAAIPYGDNWLAFFPPDSFSESGGKKLRVLRRFSTTDFLNGYVSLGVHLTSGARKRLIVRLLNRNFEVYLVQRGLQHTASSSGQDTFYVPFGLIDRDQAEFRDVGGVIRKRLLVGKSEKRGVRWHLGVACRYVSDSGDQFRLRVRLRVVFTSIENGEPVGHERAKLLRKQFCKNWWNDRWRTLFLAWLAWLSEGQSKIVLGESFELNAQPSVYTTDISIRESSTAQEIADDVLDEETDFSLSDLGDIPFDDEFTDASSRP